MQQERIGIGSDHAGFRLKESVRRWLVEHLYNVLDLGTHSEEACDYPDFAIALAEAMGAGEVERGILICGTGVGMSIVANKFPTCVRPSVMIPPRHASVEPITMPMC